MRKCLFLLPLLLATACSDDPEKCDKDTYKAQCLNGTSIRLCNDKGEIETFDAYCQSINDLAKGTELEEYNLNGLGTLATPYLENNDNVIRNGLCDDNDSIVDVLEGLECISNSDGYIINHTCKKMDDGKYYEVFSIDKCEKVCMYNSTHTTASCAKSGDACESEGPIGCTRGSSFYCVDDPDSEGHAPRVAEVKCDDGKMCIMDKENVSCRPSCPQDYEPIGYCLAANTRAEGYCMPSPWGDKNKDGELLNYPKLNAMYSGSNSDSIFCIDGDYVDASKENDKSIILPCSSDDDKYKGLCISNSAVICLHVPDYYSVLNCDLDNDAGTGSICMIKDSLPYCAEPCFEEGKTKQDDVHKVGMGTPAIGNYKCEQTPNGLFYVLQDYTIPEE